MRGARPVIVCLLAALALSGCMGRPAPAVAPQPGLDTIAYGLRPYAPAPMAVAYREPALLRHDAPYHLDAGDKLRIVVYGQEGLTNGYAIDAGGSITTPPIRPVPARGRPPPPPAAGKARRVRHRLLPRPT